MEAKFEIIQFTRRTEIEINLADEQKLIDGLKYIEFEYTIKEIDSGLIFKTKKRLNHTQIYLLKGRVIPKKAKYKPKSKVIPIYDESIVVGIGKDGYLIYKQIN